MKALQCLVNSCNCLKGISNDYQLLAAKGQLIMLPSGAANMQGCGVVMHGQVVSMHGKVILSLHGHGVICMHAWVHFCLLQAYLPATTEFTAAFVPLLLFEPQPCQHVGNALVCVIPACCLKLVHSRLQTIVCTFAACTNSTCQSARWQVNRPR